MSNHWIAGSYLVLFLFATTRLSAETISIVEAPPLLPRNTALGAYSPPVIFGYSGLKTGEVYTIKAWLLVPGSWSWNLGSTQWSERSFVLDNRNGANASGAYAAALDMDVYDQSQFAWVVRLYNQAGREVAMVERHCGSTANRAPVLDRIGSKNTGIGQKLEFTVAARDSDGGAPKLSVSNLPTGAAFDAASGKFSWTPDRSGRFSNIVFRATDLGQGPLTDAEIVEITVENQPVIRQQPKSVYLEAGGVALFSVQAESASPLYYQWHYNGNAIAGETKSSLRIENVGDRHRGAYQVVVSNSNGPKTTSKEAFLSLVVPRTSRESAELSIEHLRRVMDAYHQSFPVYEDIGSPGNRFHARGQIPDADAKVAIDGSWPSQARSGATCIKCTFSRSGDNYGGFYFLNGILMSAPGAAAGAPAAPVPYFGEAVIPGTQTQVTGATGVNLTGSVALTFWARGENGGEQVEFFMGGVGRDVTTGKAIVPFPDSTARVPKAGTPQRLTKEWQKFTIPLAGVDLSNIMGGFGWIASALNNPGGAVFYLDDIRYELSPEGLARRLEEPRFLRSFSTRPLQPSLADGDASNDLDLVLRNTAFIYDNALAVAAFIADGTPDSLRRAKLIGDAMVYAGRNDRTYTDGRMRTAYMAGDLKLPAGWKANGRSSTVPVPGYYKEADQTFEEVENADVDVGNNAWAMLALLTLHESVGGIEYLDAARRIGRFIQTFRDTSGAYQGYRGGIFNAETNAPRSRAYASTEHNLDIVAAFTRMHRITGEREWADGAEHARKFVESMWNATPNREGYQTGTIEASPESRNEAAGQLPLDTQSWSVLARPEVITLHPQVLRRTEQTHRLKEDGLDGYDFNDDRDGVWLEGTAQMAVAYRAVGGVEEAERLLETLRKAQQIAPPAGDGCGMVAASHDGVSSGFGFSLFCRPHVGATAWNVFAQYGFNPYYDNLSNAPQLRSEPRSQAVEVGGSVQLAVTAIGKTPLLYQWRKDGNVIAGATEATLRIDNMQPSQAGSYTVVVVGPGGSVTSQAAVLSLVPFSRLANISVRSMAGRGEQSQTLGFCIGGTGTKQVLCRGIGPGLLNHGVVGVLPDPRIAMYDSKNALIHQNDDWGGGAALTAAFASAYAFALQGNSKDAALLVSVPTGVFTVQTINTSSASGISLIEIYDMQAQSGRSRLVNLSARNLVGTGADSLSAGFVIAGNAPMKVLIRAIGPTLASFGVNGVLADPKLELYSGAERIGANDNWGGDAVLSSAFTAVSAFALPPNSKDAALLVTLQPGVYCAQVSSVPNATGVALVEIYEMVQN